ncbi:MAG: leucine-rich repeat domain-containing protein, partial [Burkholderiaceae bacterium]
MELFGWSKPLFIINRLLRQIKMTGISPSFSGIRQTPVIQANDVDLPAAAHPNNIAQANRLVEQAPALSRTEFENKLDEWVRDAGPCYLDAATGVGFQEDRVTAKERMMVCFDAQQNDPSSDAASSLDLSMLGLKTLPPAIGQLVNLTMLDLSNNELQSLLPAIGQLVNLTTLDLRNIQIQSLPPEIGQLVNLTYWDLGYNQFRSLPPAIGQLVNLTHWDLRNNQIQSLPASIVGLQAACYIDLENNPLPPTVIEQLGNAIQLRRASDPTRGPHIDHTMAAGPAPVARPLSEEVAAWRTEGGRPCSPDEMAHWQTATTGVA